MLSMKELGELISHKRKSLGLTQDALAEKLGITPQAVSKWENGVGYPDITLFPAIAQVFNMTTDELFGLTPIINKEEKSAEIDEAEQSEELEDLDEELEDLEDLNAEEDVIIEIDKNDGTPVITYRSLADSFKGLFRGFSKSTNEHIEYGFVGEDEKEFDSIYIDVSGATDINILSGNTPRIEAEGSQKFFEHFSHKVENRTLKVTVTPYSANNEHNIVDIYCSFVKGNDLTAILKGATDVKTEIDFETAKINISGAGDFVGENFGKIEAKVSGAGDVDFKSADDAKVLVSGSGDTTIEEIRSSLNATISGAGDLSVIRAKNVSVAASGSSDTTIGEVSGNLSFTGSGSCDAKANGKVDELYISLSGSCDFSGKALYSTNAELYASGPSSIEIGLVSGNVKQKISAISDLTIIG